MPITAQDNRRSYTGDGATRDYDVPPITANTDLAVAVNGVPQSLGTDYTVSQINEEDGGRVTFLAAPAGGAVITIVRRTPPTQPMRLRDGDPVPSQAMNRAHDRRAMVEQYLWDRAAHSLAFDDLDPTGEKGFQAGGAVISGVAPGTEPDHVATVGQMSDTLTAAGEAVTQAQDAISQAQAAGAAAADASAAAGNAADAANAAAQAAQDAAASVPDEATLQDAIDGVENKFTAPKVLRDWVRIDELFEQDGSGVSRRDFISKMRDVVSITDFGVNNRGAGDAGDAMNKALAAIPQDMTANSAYIYIPAGLYQVHQTIQSGDKPVYVIGDGAKASRLVCDQNGIDIWSHTGAVPYASLSIRGVSFNAVANVRHGLHVEMNGDSGSFHLRDIRFDTWAASYSFERAVFGRGITNTVWRDVWSQGHAFETDPAVRAVGQPVAFEVRSSSNSERSFVLLFENVLACGEESGFRFVVDGAPGNAGSIEGVVFHNCFGRTNAGPWVDVQVTTSNGSWYPPFYIMDKCNWQGVGSVFRSTGVSGFTMTNCMHFHDSPLADSVDQKMVDIQNGRQISIRNNDFQLLPNAKVSNIINIGADNNVVEVTGNRFYADPGAEPASAIQVDPAAANVRVADNLYRSPWPAGSAKELTGASPIDLALRSNGASIRTYTNNGEGAEIRNSYGTDAVARIVLDTGGPGTSPMIKADGPAENIPITLQTKGVSPVVILNGVMLANQALFDTATGGSAQALPAQPYKYLVWNINGENLAIPLYKFP